MLSRRSLLAALLLLVVLDSCSAMSIRQLYDRAVSRSRQDTAADSSFGFLQHDDASESRPMPRAEPVENVRSGNDVRLPIQGVSRMLMRFAPDYSTEVDDQ